MRENTWQYMTSTGTVIQNNRELLQPNNKNKQCS